MSYGAKAVIPIETGFPTLRTQSFNPSNNDELLERSLDLIEERRESAMVQLAYYHHKLKVCQVSQTKSLSEINISLYKYIKLIAIYFQCNC